MTKREMVDGTLFNMVIQERNNMRRALDGTRENIARIIMEYDASLSMEANPVIDRIRKVIQFDEMAERIRQSTLENTDSHVEGT